MAKKLRTISLYAWAAAILAFNQQVAVAPAQTPHKAYILCETKTGEASRWFFSAIFMEGPEVAQHTMEVAFTNYVIDNYRKGDGIGPADCYIDRTRQDAEYHHTQQQKWATSQGNTVVETSWTYSE